MTWSWRLVRQVREDRLERGQLVSPHVEADRQIGQLLGGYAHIKEGGALADAPVERGRRGIHSCSGRHRRCRRHRSLPSKSNLSNPGLSLDGPSWPIAVVTGAVGSSMGWSSGVLVGAEAVLAAPGDGMRRQLARQVVGVHVDELALRG